MRDNAAQKCSFLHLFAPPPPFPLHSPSAANSATHDASPLRSLSLPRLRHTFVVMPFRLRRLFYPARFFRLFFCCLLQRNHPTNTRARRRVTALRHQPPETRKKVKRERKRGVHVKESTEYSAAPPSHSFILHLSKACAALPVLSDLIFLSAFCFFCRRIRSALAEVVCGSLQGDGEHLNRGNAGNVGRSDTIATDKH